MSKIKDLPNILSQCEVESVGSGQSDEEKKQDEMFGDLEQYLNPLDFLNTTGEKGGKIRGEYVNKGKKGRKFKYPTPKALWEKCKEYFDQCDEAGMSYTVSDLSFHLGFCSKQAVNKISKYDNDLGKVMSFAKLKIEGQRNRQAVDGQGQNTGRIFDLKANFGWIEEEKERELEQKKKQSEQKDSQNNFFINAYTGLPPQPESMEEWVSWYEKQKRQVQSGEQKQEAKDVTPEQE